MNLFELYKIMQGLWKHQPPPWKQGTRSRRAHATMGKSHFAKVKARNRRRSQIARLSRRVNRQRAA
jgi:hypothetical protein